MQSHTITFQNLILVSECLLSTLATGPIFSFSLDSSLRSLFIVDQHLFRLSPLAHDNNHCKIIVRPFFSCFRYFFLSCPSKIQMSVQKTCKTCYSASLSLSSCLQCIRLFDPCVLAILLFGAWIFIYFVNIYMYFSSVNILG